MPSIAASAARPVDRLPGGVGERRPTSARCGSSRPSPGRRRRRRRPAPGRPARPGSACAVASSDASSRPRPAPAGRGRASPGRAGRAGRPRACARPGRAARRRRRRCVEPAAVRPSTCSRSRTVVVASATFWWMHELANRVSASAVWSATTSASAAGAGDPPDQLDDPAAPGRAPLTLMPAPPPVRSVNRAGAAGWPVCPIWPGWPLPQFGVPHAMISEDEHVHRLPEPRADPGVGRVAQHPARACRS